MKKNKIIICMSLALSLIFMNVLAINDISGHWAEKYIQELVDKGVVNGFPNGNFKPEARIKVGEYLKICVLNFTDDNDINQFKNQSNEHWASPYYRAALKNKLVFSDENEFKNFDKDMTRGEIARILGRIAEIKNIDTGYNLINESLKINDYDKISEDDKEGVLKMIRLGVITGYEDNTFRSNDLALRCEFSAMIYRFQNPKKIKSVFLDPEILITEGDGVNTNSFMIIIDYNGNVENQLQTAKTYLQTKVSIAELDKIMAYIKFKEKASDALPMRYFDWKGGKIMIHAPKASENLVIIAE